MPRMVARRWRGWSILARAAVGVAGASPRCPQPALRVDQEHARRDDGFSLSEPLENLYSLFEPSAEPYGARYEAAFARDHEDVLSAACVDDGIARNGEGVAGAHLEGGTPVNAGS